MSMSSADRFRGRCAALSALLLCVSCTELPHLPIAEGADASAPQTGGANRGTGGRQVVDGGTGGANHDDAGDASGPMDAGGDMMSVERRPTGATCRQTDECQSGACIDHVCCGVAACGTCMTCASGTGICEPVRNEDDLDSCTDDRTCDVMGTCGQRIAANCVEAGECATGSCVDGVCCATDVCGACEVCSAATGTCQPVVEGVDEDSCTNGMSCDRAGTCLVADGGSCAEDRECATGDCVDGVCCGQEACGVCEVCGELGQCQPLRNADDVDTCGGQQICDAAGLCRIRAAAACNRDGECASGYCVDGVCCETDSCGECEVCSGATGTCQPVRDAADPDSCVLTTRCNQNGQCRNAPGRSCAVAAECASGNCLDGVCCSAASCGVCEACEQGTGTCAAVLSAPDADSCSGTATCTAAGACRYRAGEECSNAGQCESGFCVDGVCCGASSCGACQACAVGTGSCQSVVGQDDLDSCTGGQTCSATAACLSKDGQACGSDTQCASGDCVDGVCCGASACGTCQACALGTGECTPVVGADDPDSCTGSDTCSASGQCRRRSGAVCSAGSQCVTGSCVDGACCSQDVCGTCEACTGALGTCETVTNATDPDTCSGTLSCSASGVCALRNGEGCGSAGQCVSGGCVDGVCCNATCSETCAACNLSGTLGICSPVENAVDADSCGPSPAMCTSVSACATLDQQQLSRDTTVSMAVGGGSEQKFAQVIVPGLSGNLVEVRVWVGCSAGATLQVQLQGVSAGAPDGSVIATTTANGQFSRPRAFRFTTPPAVTAGVPVALVLSASGSCGGDISDGDVYVGNSYYDARPNASGWVQMSDDLVFEILVD